TVAEKVIGNGDAIELNVSAEYLKPGENPIVVMAAVGGCSAVPLSNPAPVEGEKIYGIENVTSSRVCGEGRVTLTATGAPVDGFYRGYETAESTEAVKDATSAEFITPVLNKSKTYYVAAVNALGCE